MLLLGHVTHNCTSIAGVHLVGCTHLNLRHMHVFSEGVVACHVKLTDALGLLIVSAIAGKPDSLGVSLGHLLVDD